MKTIGIEIKSLDAIIVVLEEGPDGSLLLCPESTKISINDSLDSDQVKQFRASIGVTLDGIKADRIGIIARNGKTIPGQRGPSPFSFKIEGIIQLYDKTDVEIVWPQTISAFQKKTPDHGIEPRFNYQLGALNLAHYLLNTSKK